jgi:hypothetical protein
VPKKFSGGNHSLLIKGAGRNGYSHANNEAGPLPDTMYKN